MAANDDDIELSIGVNFDEKEISESYKKVLKDISKETKAYLTDAMDEMKGAAAKSWGPLPFYSMHDATSGNKIASEAFLAGLAKDLPSMGATKGSFEYESALMNAVYRSSITDPMQRYHRMLSEGRVQAADITHPDTPLGKAIESNFALMSQPWARDFTKAENGTRYIDFAGMRKYAVGAGLGRWIDPEQGETADNFELINDELEKIEEGANKTEKSFLNWHDTLKGVLGTLTAIGAGIGLLAKINAVAEKTTLSAAGSIDKRRAFIGMSALDELRTRVASKAVGMGEDSIRDEIYSMSENIEQYKLLGQGDALPSALLGIFDNLMGAEDPYDIYTKSADEIYNQLKGADPQTRRRWLMLMNKAGLGSMSNLVGQFLSNPDYAKTYKTPSALFELTNNPFYGVYEQAEQLAPALAKINESIKASYAQLALDWEDSFGVEFKSWWDLFLKNLVVPGAAKAEKAIKSFAEDPVGTLKKGQENTSFAYDWASFQEDISDAMSRRKLNSMEKDSQVWSSAAAAAIMYDDKAYWLNFSVPTDMIKGKLTAANVKKLEKAKTGELSGSAFISGLEDLADARNYKSGTLDNTKTAARRAKADDAIEWLKDTGLYETLSKDKGNPDAVSKAIMRVVLESLSSPSSSDTTLANFRTNLYSQIPEVQELVADFLKTHEDYLYSGEHQKQLLEVQIHLKDKLGVDIPIEVDEKTLKYADGTVVNR